MNTTENIEAVSISFKEMMILFLKRLWLILLVAILVGGAAFAYLTYTYEEEYTSKSTIYLFYKEEGRSGSAAISYLEVALYTLNDCEQIITSRRVLNSVIEDILDDTDLPRAWRREVNQMGYSGLKRSISISNVTDSRVLEISVRTSDPELSKEIVDRICARGASEIKYYMGFDQVRVLDEGTLNYAPSNSVSLLIPIVLAMAAGLLIYVIALLAKLNDDRITCAEDIEKYMGLSVLGEIPAFAVAASKAKKYY